MSLPAPKKYFSPWNLLYFALGLALLVFLLNRVDFHGLVQLIVKSSPVFLLLAGLVYLGKAGLRALRFYRMISAAQAAPAAGYGRMLRLSLASSLASQVLPLKLGELSYVYLLKKDYRSSIARGLSSLVVIRIFDLLAISLLFLAVAFFSKLPPSLSAYFYSILVFMAFLLAVIIAVLAVSRSGASILAWAFRRPLVQKIPLSGKLRRGLEDIFQQLNQYPPRALGEWTLLALLEWLVNYEVYHLMLVGAGMAPRFFDTVVGVTFAALASVLPVNSFGNFGTQEAGWSAGLVLLGYSQSAAINSAFATHLLSLLYLLLFGGAAWLSYLFVRSKPGAEIEAVGQR